MKKLYLSIAVLAAFLTSFTTFGQAGCGSLAITNTTATGANITCSGSATFTATASGTGDAIYWYDAATGGALVHTGATFQTPTLTSTTSYWATEVLYSGGGGGSMPTGYCTPAVLTTGCTGGDEIEDFTLTDANGTKLIEHLASGCSANNYGDFTGDPALAANLTVGDTYNFVSTNDYGSLQYLNIWIDFNRNGSFADPGEEVFVSGQSGGTITGSFVIPATAQSGPTVMRITDMFGGNAADACNGAGSYGETHDYKVTLISVACESPRVQVTATVTGNPNLDITSTTTGAVCGEGSVTLEATASGTGDAIFWYDAAAGGDKVGEGTTIMTPEISTTTSYWAAEVNVTGSTLTGQGKPVPTGTATTTLDDYGLEFDVTETFTLISVDVYPTSSGSVTVELQDSSGSVIQTAAASVSGSGPVTIPLNFTIPPGMDYRLMKQGSVSLIRDFSGNNFPYLLGPSGNYGEITSGRYSSGTSTSYYFFYNWSVSTEIVSCESPREEVVATVNNVADKEIALPFPYTDTDNTSNFANNYFGGTCGYLDGRDVVYHFQADDNYLLNVGLSALSAGESSVFVYKSCDDIGENCIAGETNDFTTDYDFDLTVSNGQDYYIVVSSSENTSALGYTLSITGTVIDCTDYQITATTDDSITCKGKADLSATGSGSALAEFYWYDAATGGNKVHEGPNFRTPDLSATTSYWVTEVLPESGGTGIVCESPRVQVVATITTAPDIAIAALPYVDTNNDTGNYGNPYEGEPGSSCNTPENYLNGNDVVYQFTAANTELVDIILSDLTGFYAGVFVYDDCPGLADTCLAGAVAGPNDADFEIENFQVTAGEDYYVVVSSWLTPTVGYTLEITPFNCADFQAPSANPVQEFVTNETVGDIEVDPSSIEQGATLNWYDANGNPLPDSTVLIDGNTYCVTQTFNGCESPEFCITMNEIDCSTLAITNAADVTINCKGSVTLTATGSGTGQEFVWYDAATDGNQLGTGSSFETPLLTATTSYWVAEAKATGVTYSGFGELVGSGDMDNYYDDTGLEFVANEAFTIVSVVVYNEDDAAQTVDIQLKDANDNVLQSINANLPAGNGTSGGPSAPTTVQLNFAVPGAGTYRLVTANNNADLLQQTSANYPYDLGPGGIAGQITGGTGSTSSYYNFFYNWTISTGNIICESPREEVVVTVADAGDINVDYTQVQQPGGYTTTDNTLPYGDNFDGDPGSGCDGTAILDGSEVIYKYTADPTNDDILDIELTGINNPNTGMYIYASCSDIGSACLIGGTSQGGGAILIDDYYATAGTNFFIVISSEFGSTGYTLTINGIDCANLAGPTTPDATPLFVQGDDLAGLTINGNTYNTQYTWYDNLADVGDSSLAISDQTTLVDGEDYYVTQTVLSCESQALKITPDRFHCQDLKVIYAPDQTICAPGGPVQLEANGSNFGTEIYWYDAPSGGTLLSTGTTYTVTVNQTTSFWAVNVYLLQDGRVLCGSDPVEVTVTVNDQPTATPTGTASQDFCEGDTVADIVLNEPNLTWYDSATGTNSLPSGTPLQDGTTYYASQTVNACESTGRFAVTVNVTPVAAVPAGEINQLFLPGETLVDLDVTGDTLTWYSDPSGDPSTIIPDTTVLIDQETYYVSQQPTDFCESELLPVTVHVDPVFDTDDPVFEALSYYPNPVRERLTIRHKVRIESVAVFDLLGKQIIQQRVGASNINLNTGHLQSGTYLLKVTIDGKTGVFKLIKE